MATAALALGSSACGWSGDDDGPTSTTTSSSRPPAATTSTIAAEGAATTTVTVAAPATAATQATTATTAGSTPGTPATSKPAPAMTVTLYARKGEVPPGQTAPLDAPAWRATGVGWEPGHVDLVVKRSDGPSVVLDIGAQADDAGRFEQTFVVLDVDPGTYVATASQGANRAESSFVL